MCKVLNIVKGVFHSICPGNDICLHTLDNGNAGICCVAEHFLESQSCVEMMMSADGYMHMHGVSINVVTDNVASSRQLTVS